MNEKIVKLFCDESKIVFADGTIFEGALGVSTYVVNVFNASATLGLKRGLTIGFVGGIAVSGFGVLTYMNYKSKKSK